MRIEYLTLEEVKYVAHRLAHELLEWGEPIPAFETRFPGILEQCLAAPRQTYARKMLYRGLLGKAAILFYLLVKNHPFQNGNKRVAVMTLLYFLHKNSKWVRVDTQEFYNFARWVAESNPKVKEQVVDAITQFLKENLVDARPETNVT